MDDGEVEALAHRGDDSSENFQNSEEFLDEFLNGSRTCTHTHTCNPPGPDTAHTHTCFHTHTHTKVFSSDDKSRKTSKRPLGNREAVRKYREKKKAHTAYLEEEVKKLRSLNQQLFRKLQGQAALESEISRLRSLLFDIRSKIDIQLDHYPFQSHCIAVNNISSVSKAGNGCGVQCDSSRLQSNIIGLSSQTQQMNGNRGALGSWEDQDCQNAVLECCVNGIEGSNGGKQVEQ